MLANTNHMSFPRQIQPLKREVEDQQDMGGFFLRFLCREPESLDIHVGINIRLL